MTQDHHVVDIVRGAPLADRFAPLSAPGRQEIAALNRRGRTEGCARLQRKLLETIQRGLLGSRAL